MMFWYLPASHTFQLFCVSFLSSIVPQMLQACSSLRTFAVGSLLPATHVLCFLHGWFSLSLRTSLKVFLLRSVFLTTSLEKHLVKVNHVTIFNFHYNTSHWYFSHILRCLFSYCLSRLSGMLSSMEQRLLCPIQWFPLGIMCIKYLLSVWMNEEMNDLVFKYTEAACR